MMTLSAGGLAATSVFEAASATSGAKTTSPSWTAPEGNRYQPPLVGTRGVISAVTNEGAIAGIDVLDKGGNAVDAAIAAALVDGVAAPFFCGIGGGFLMTYYGADGTALTLDAIEALPLEYPDDYFDPNASAMYAEAIGHRVVGVPGAIRGFHEMYQRLGSKNLNWSELFMDEDPASTKRAEGLARNGVIAGPEFGGFAASEMKAIQSFPETRKTYLIGETVPYPPGSRVVQEAYARSLRLIAQQGPDVMYSGELGQAIANSMANAPIRTDQDPRAFALWAGDSGDASAVTMRDFVSYEAKWRQPLVGQYGDAKVIAFPPPTTGGLIILETLNILRRFPLGSSDGAPLPGDLEQDRDWTPHSANTLHTIGQAQKIAWADDHAHMGDSDFVDVPLQRLLSNGYAQQRAGEIQWRNQDFDPLPPQPSSAGHTCTLAVIDEAGNAVALTSTIGGAYGSGVIAPDTGFLLGQSFDNMPTTGQRAHQPGMRRPTWMSPTIVVRHGEPVLVVGGVGGSTIPDGVFNTVFNVVQYGMDPAHALDAPKVAGKPSPAHTGWGKSRGGEPCGERFLVEAAHDDDVFSGPTRIPMTTQWKLTKRWLPEGEAPEIDNALCRFYRANVLNEFDDYEGLPFQRAVGIDPATGLRQATMDPRSMQLTPGPLHTHIGSAAQAP